MRVPKQPDLIGIDGGGTSCRVALLWRGARFEAQTGPANATTDLDGTLATIRAGLAQVATDAGQDIKTLAGLPAYIGLAGVLTPAIAARVAAGLPLTNAVVADDRVSALAGALGDADGAVASIGTGSFLARQQAGQVWLIGGYGLHLGDEASGAWLGRALLTQVLHVADGLAPASGLSETIFARFNHDPAEIVGFAARADPPDYGSFAPDIATAAMAGDAIAVALMHSGADYIARGLAALGWQAGEPLALLGGVARHYQPFLKPEIARAITSPKSSALDGALRLAARRAQDAAP